MKSVLVALVAVLALGAVAASGASAHEFFIEGKSMKELGIKEEAVTSTIGEVTVSSAAGIEVICQEGSGVGTIREGGTGSSTLELSECRVPKPANCGVGPIVLKNTVDDLVEVGGKLADEFAAGGGFLFTMTIVNNGGSCSAAGAWPAEGQITGKVVSEAEKEAGELSFSSTSGSKVFTGSWGLNFSFKDKVKLSGANKGKKWSARK